MYRTVDTRKDDTTDVISNLKIIHCHQPSIMMTSTTTLLVLFCVFQTLLDQSLALFADEAGIADFLVSTTGHGPTRFVHSYDGSVVTSDAETSCFVASRSIETGALNWRRNVCANAEQTRHAVAATETAVYTMDSSGLVRAWSRSKGHLLWDALLAPTQQPRIFVGEAIAAVADDQLLFLDASTGDALGEPLSAQKVLSDHIRGRGQAQWLQMAGDWRFVAGWVSNRDGIVTTSGNDMLLVDLKLEDEQVTIPELHRLNHIQQFDVSSLNILPSGSGLALSADGKQVLSFELRLVK